MSGGGYGMPTRENRLQGNGCDDVGDFVFPRVVVAVGTLVHVDVRGSVKWTAGESRWLGSVGTDNNGIVVIIIVVVVPQRREDVGSVGDGFGGIGKKGEAIRLRFVNGAPVVASEDNNKDEGAGSSGAAKAQVWKSRRFGDVFTIAARSAANVTLQPSGATMLRYRYLVGDGGSCHIVNSRYGGREACVIVMTHAADGRQHGNGSGAMVNPHAEA